MSSIQGKDGTKGQVPPQAQPLPRGKDTFLTILVIWLLVSLVLTVLQPVITMIPFLVGTLLLTLVVVPVAGYVVMPLAYRALARWLAQS